MLRFRGLGGPPLDRSTPQAGLTCSGHIASEPRQGLTIEASRFVPRPPGDTLVNGMTLERWINADSDMPLLVKAALGALPVRDPAPV